MGKPTAQQAVREIQRRQMEWGWLMFEQLVRLAEHLKRGLLFRWLLRTPRHEPGEPFAMLDAAFERLADKTEANEEVHPAVGRLSQGHPAARRR